MQSFTATFEDIRRGDALPPQCKQHKYLLIFCSIIIILSIIGMGISAYNNSGILNTPRPRIIWRNCRLLHLNNRDAICFWGDECPTDESLLRQSVPWDSGCECRTNETGHVVCMLCCA